MCSSPLDESAEPAFKRRKNIKHFTAFHPVRLFCTPIHTRHTHTKWTRTTSVIYAPFADQTETHKNETQLHNTVLFNTTAWGSHPYASPEGHGTTPYENCQLWSTVGPLGAATRLTALLPAPNDISKLMNSRQPNITPEAPNDSSPSFFANTNTSPQLRERATT